MNLRVLIIVGVGLGLMPSGADAASARAMKEAMSVIFEKLDGWLSAPKRADDLPPATARPKSSNQDLGLNGPLITRSLARASHNRTCPAMRLRLSLPQLNVNITVPKNLNIRKGPGIRHQRQARFTNAGTYSLDLLKTDECWIQIRYPPGGDRVGCASAKHMSFEFDNHLTKPQKRLNRILGASGVYKMVARSTYKIETPRATGTAVAISPTVLLTNCHVLGNFDSVHIIESLIQSSIL